MSSTDILFVHNNFPGQFGFIAAALKARGMRCMAIGSPSAKSPHIPVRQWKLARGSTKGIYPMATRAEADLIRGHAAAEVAAGMRDEGFDPRLIIGHPGWGETTLLSEIFPKARQILHGEFYYRADGGDVGFDPEFGTPNQEERLRVAAKNIGMALAYVEADRIVSPTAFQASFFPPHLAQAHADHPRGRGDRRHPASTWGEGEDRQTSDAGPFVAPVITFINRHFEPLRGYHIFMRALPALLAAVPQAHVVMVGAKEGRGYGLESKDGTWAQKYLDEVKDKLDLSRIHFTGPLAHPLMLDVLNISAAHVYYTYPFVLSWSLLEAMASECLILGSDTGPLRDAVQDGVNGRLLNFFDVDALSQAMIEACQKPEAFQPLRVAARQTVVDRFDRAAVCQPAWLALIDEVLAEGWR